MEVRDDLVGAAVVDADGLEGRILEVEPDPAAAGAPRLVLALPGGRRALAPAAALVRREDGRLLLPIRLGAAVAAPPDGTSIPIVEERLVARRRRVVAGKVRVAKRVHEREERVDEPLLRERVEVTRVPVGAWVEAPVPVRQEGDTIVVPVLEEVLVVEKRLRLVEEVRVTKRQTEVRAPETVTLRREEAIVERVGPASATGEPTASS